MKPLSELTTNNQLLIGHFLEETKLTTQKKDYIAYRLYVIAMNKPAGVKINPYPYETFLKHRRIHKGLPPKRVKRSYY